jgi:pSer/pThr/pTyr-binding forkhead associated (FHA) protein
VRVILEIRSDRIPPRRVALAEGQTLKIGRTEWADLALPDPFMSGIHFSLSVTSNECRLEDLGSGNGTFVNGERIKSTTLHDRDQITAGRTNFGVVIEDGPEGTRARAKNDRAGVQIILSEPAPTGRNAVLPPTSRKIEYRKEVCVSGLVAVSSGEQAPSADSVVRLLSQSFPLYVVADFNRLGRPLPEKPGSYDFLIDWVPEDSKKKYSPLVFGGSGEPLTWIEECWGKDALIAVFSRAEKPKLLGRLRLMAGAFSRPSILTPQLVFAGSPYAANVLAEIDGVLVEDPKPGQWKLLMLPDSKLLASLGQLGFCERTGDNLENPQKSAAT